MEQGGSKLIGLVVQVALARMLSPETFGVMAVLLVLINVADSIGQSGVGAALIQRDSVKQKDFSTAFWLSLSLAAIVCSLLWLTAPFIAAFYRNDELVWLLRGLSFVVVFNSANSVQRSLLQRNMEFKKLFYANVFAVAFSGVVGVGAAFAGAGIWALILQALSQSIGACIVMAGAGSWKPSFEFDGVVARGLYAYGWKICVAGILNVLYVGISELIIGKVCSPVDLGYYSQGRKWPTAAVGIAGNAFQNVLFPAFSLVKGDKNAFARAMRRGLISGSFVVIPIAFFFAVAAAPLVELLLTDVWMPCVPVFQITCLLSSLLLPQVVNLRAYMALGRSGLYMKLQIVKVFIGVAVIGLAAVLSRDIYIVALATAAVSLFNVIIVDLWPAKVVIGYSRGRQLKDVLPMYLLSAVASAVAFLPSLASLPVLAELSVEAVVFAIVYLGIAKLLRFEALSDCVSMVRRVVRGQQ